MVADIYLPDGFSRLQGKRVGAALTDGIDCFSHDEGRVVDCASRAKTPDALASVAIVGQEAIGGIARNHHVTRNHQRRKGRS
jgi:hypothetical protein